tara:strand:+ start:632 stop:829 length:198 start_codon:yes stop_codon:yes gene_type:complete
MRIELFPERCIGVGQCVLAAPDVFDQDEEDGIVFMIHEKVPVERRNAVLAAARLCPTVAIVVHDD